MEGPNGQGRPLRDCCCKIDLAREDWSFRKGTGWPPSHKHIAGVNTKTRRARRRIIRSLRPASPHQIQKKSQNKTFIRALRKFDPIQSLLLRCLHQTSRARPRQRGADAMWSTLFTITFVIAVALSFAAVVMDYANGGPQWRVASVRNGISTQFKKASADRPDQGECS